MNEYIVIVTETSTTEIDIVASSEEDAIQTAEEMYQEGILSYNCNIDYEIKNPKNDLLRQKKKLLSDAELEIAYRIRLNYYQLEDAKAHYDNYVKNNGLKPIAIPTGIDYQNMVEEYNCYHDCNIAENDLWESIIEQYFQYENEA